MSRRRISSSTARSRRSRARAATKVFQEKISGVRADPPQLAKLMAALAPCDVVIVTKLDRLGRSTRELLELIDRISKAGAAFRSLGDPLWNTSSPQGRLLSTLLAAIAEFERELIRERTGEGRKRAMAAGIKFGRKRKLVLDQKRRQSLDHLRYAVPPLRPAGNKTRRQPLSPCVATVVDKATCLQALLGGSRRKICRLASAAVHP